MAGESLPYFPITNVNLYRGPNRELVWLVLEYLSLLIYSNPHDIDRIVSLPSELVEGRDKKEIEKDTDLVSSDQGESGKLLRKVLTWYFLYSVAKSGYMNIFGDFQFSISPVHQKNQPIN
jgi:hypothetical protein